MSNNSELRKFFDSIANFFKYLFSNWKLILVVSLLAAVIGLFVAIKDKLIYSAKLSFVVEEESKSGLSQYSNLASQIGLGGSSVSKGIYSAENLIEFMRSRNMIERALLTKSTRNPDKLLIDRYIEIHELKDDLIKKQVDLNFNKQRSLFNYSQDSLLSEIYSNIFHNEIGIEKPDKKLDFIYLTVISYDENFAKEFSEALISNVIENYKLNKTRKARKNVDILQKRADSVLSELNLSLNSRAIASDNNLNVVRQKANVSKAKQEVNIQLQSGLYSELIKNLELAKFNLMNSEPIIQIIDSPILPLEKIKLSKRKGLLIGMLIGFSISIFALILNRVYKEIYS